MLKHGLLILHFLMLQHKVFKNGLYLIQLLIQLKFVELMVHLHQVHQIHMEVEEQLFKEILH